MLRLLLINFSYLTKACTMATLSRVIVRMIMYQEVLCVPLLNIWIAFFNEMLVHHWKFFSNGANYIISVLG